MPRPTRAASGNVATPLCVGLVGYGLAGSRFHAPLIASCPALRLSAVVTRDPGRRVQAQREHPGVVVFPDLDAMLTRAELLDLVVIASPNRTHAPLARRALETGLAVVVDKPMATTAADARRLVADARARGLPLTVFQNRRWDGDFLTVQRLLREGRLGRPLRFESRFERWRPEPRPGWRELGTPDDAGGVLYDLGSHLIDQALMLFGPVVSVYAELDVRRPGVQVEDDAFVALTHASGVRSHLWMSAIAAQQGPRLRVLGDRAAYTRYGLDPQEAWLRAGARPDIPHWGEEHEEAWGVLGAGDVRERVPTEAGQWPSFYASVASALRDGSPLPVDPDDAVQGLEIIEAARRSAREHVTVALPRASASLA